MNALSLFSGIGGLDLAAEMAGIKVKAFCEIEPFPVAVLTKRFSGVPIFEDVRKLTAEVIRDRTGMDTSQTIDVIFGGFPCQDLSQAGKQAGLTGARSGLWFEMLRVISELRPRYVVAENVRGAVNLALDTVYSNLVNEGYKVYPYVIPASAVGAPHQRERLFVVGVRENVHRRYTEVMENPGCELRQGSCQCREVEREAREGVASDSEFSSGTLCPTPTGTERSGINPKTGSGAGLSKTVKMWPTPRQFMYKDSITDRNKGNIGEKVGGQLNPDWVEQLMNFPEGWTNLEVDEPKQWQGWPALLGDRLWGAHTSTVACRSNRFLENADKAMSPVEFVQKGDSCYQYPYEFPRTTTGCKDRAKRLKALGNAVVPAQAYPFFRAIMEIEKTIKGGGNPMKIGERGYLIEVGMKGIREDKWLKPPLYELIQIQQGFNVTHYVFRSVEGGYKRTMMDKDFDLGQWAFADTPEPISRSEHPRLRARIADISKHSHMTQFNKGGFSG